MCQLVDFNAILLDEMKFDVVFRNRVDELTERNKMLEQRVKNHEQRVKNMEEENQKLREQKLREENRLLKEQLFYFQNHFFVQMFPFLFTNNQRIEN